MIGRTYMLTPAESIGRARAHLADLSNMLEALTGGSPWLFEGSEPRVRSVFEHLRRARERLANPVLRLATFGTTSSGKSTLVNALIGRRVAPMDAGELSAGVLHIVDADDRSVEFQQTDGATWPCGVFHGTDGDLYRRIRNVLLEYRKLRATDVPPPAAVARGPLLPARWPELLALPQGVRFEVADLPGVNHAHDQESLRVLQREVLGAFCLVALDYGHTDSTSRAALLTELKRSVDALGGQTDAMVFVLNRVDLRGPLDEPLAERIAVLEEEIGKVLELTSRPVLFPVQAKLLFYTQTMWGPSSLYGEPACPPDEARLLFSDFRDDPVYGRLARRAEDDPEFNQHLGRLRADPTSVFERKWLLETAMLEMTGGKALWEAILARVAEKFSTLVLFPAVAEALDEVAALLAAAGESCRIRKIATVDEVKRQRKELSAALERARNEILQKRGELQRRFDGAIDAFRTADPKRVNDACNDLGPAFKPVLQVVQKVSDDVADTLIVPVRDAFCDGTPVGDLEERVSAVVGPKLAASLAKSVDLYRSHGMTREAAKKGLHQERRKGDFQELDDTANSALRVYARMRECLGQRAGLKLQEYARVFEGALAQVLDGHADEVYRVVSQQFAQDKAIRRAFVAARLPPSEFPNVDFRIERPVAPTTATIKVPSGQVLVEDPSCFGDRKYETTYEDVAVRRLDLPSAREMADEWGKGIHAEHGRLWGMVATWMQERLVRQGERFEHALREVHAHLDRQYEARLGELSSRLESRLAKLEEIEASVERAKGCAARLGATTRGAE